MKQEIHITLQFDLATGKVGLNEIVYELKELRDPLMLKKGKELTDQEIQFLVGLVMERIEGQQAQMNNFDQRTLSDLQGQIERITYALNMDLRLAMASNNL